MSSEGWKEQRENNWAVWLTEQGGEIGWISVRWPQWGWDMDGRGFGARN